MSHDFNVVAESVTTTSTTGGVTVKNGTLALTSGAIQAYSTPTATLSLATASGTTITPSGAIVRASASAVTTAGSCTFAAGTVDGQIFTLINEGANSIIATGNVRGTTTVSTSTAASFVWVTAYTQWVRIAGA